MKAKTGSKEDKVISPLAKLIPDAETIYIVMTKERPIEGRANEDIERLLAEHFDIARSHVRLIAGAKSTRKVYEIKGIIR